MTRTWPDPDELRPAVGQVVHASNCPGSRLVRRDGTRAAVLTCQSCGRWATTPRRNEWR